MPKKPEITSRHFRIYDGKGRPASIDDIVRAAAVTDVVFIGEEHDDPVGHFLESALFKRLDEAYGSNDVDEHGRRIVLSLEMFERDVQTVIHEYLGDLITERHFLKAARPWPNYRTDYRPLIEYARSRDIPVIAANVPGRYVNRVARLGRSSLAQLFPASRAWLPPLPYGEPSPSYREKFETFWNEVNKDGAVHGPAAKPTAETSGMKRSSAPGTPSEPSSETLAAFERMMDAQSLWDAGMAWSIAQALEQYSGALVIHVNGKFHSEYGLGIPEHLVQYRPGASFFTVTILSLPTFPAFNPAAAGSGDFIIVTDPTVANASALSDKERE